MYGYDFMDMHIETSVPMVPLEPNLVFETAVGGTVSQKGHYFKAGEAGCELVNIVNFGMSPSKATLTCTGPVVFTWMSSATGVFVQATAQCVCSLTFAR